VGGGGGGGVGGGVEERGVGWGGGSGGGGGNREKKGETLPSKTKEKDRHDDTWGGLKDTGVLIRERA